MKLEDWEFVDFKVLPIRLVTERQEIKGKQKKN